MRPAHWLPPVLWMGVIMALSTDAASAEHTRHLLLPVLRLLLPWATPGQLDTIHGLLRKGAHLTEYAILAALWYRAFIRDRRLASRAAGWLAFGISLGWAALDEWHQSFLPSRTPSPLDVAIDGAGAALAVAVASGGLRTALDGAAIILLWLAATGGAAVIAIDAWAGVPSSALWVTTPTAVAALLVRRMLARRRLRRRPDAGGRGSGPGREGV
jgi:VanZ family protein